jgi:hypothetical protein
MTRGALSCGERLSVRVLPPEDVAAELRLLRLDDFGRRVGMAVNQPVNTASDNNSQSLKQPDFRRIGPGTSANGLGRLPFHHSADTFETRSA